MDWWGSMPGRRAFCSDRKRQRATLPRVSVSASPTWRSCGPMTFKRITVRADQMGGVPCIRGLRIPVATVVGMVADGMTREEILADYPDLEAEDIEEALRYAAEAVRERELPLAPAG